MEHKGFPEQALRLFAGRQQTDGGGAGLKTHHGNPVRVAAESRYVFFDPSQRSNLVKEAEVQGIGIRLPAGHFRKINETEDTQTVIEADAHNIRAGADQIAAVHQRIGRPAVGKIAVVEQHDDRLFPVRLFTAHTNIQRQAVLALPVML